jgi:hypothetical protein
MSCGYLLAATRAALAVASFSLLLLLGPISEPKVNAMGSLPTALAVQIAISVAEVLSRRVRSACCGGRRGCGWRCSSLCRSVLPAPGRARLWGLRLRETVNTRSRAIDDGPPPPCSHAPSPRPCPQATLRPCSLRASCSNPATIVCFRPRLGSTAGPPVSRPASPESVPDDDEPGPSQRRRGEALVMSQFSAC